MTGQVRLVGVAYVAGTTSEWIVVFMFFPDVLLRLVVILENCLSGEGEVAAHTVKGLFGSGLCIPCCFSLPVQVRVESSRLHLPPNRIVNVICIVRLHLLVVVVRSVVGLHLQPFVLLVDCLSFELLCRQVKISMYPFIQAAVRA